MPTLLVIDDSDHARDALCGAVAPSGLFDTVLQARDGFQGLRILLEKTVDLVVCRLEVAGLDGTKLLAALREHPQSATVPLFFLTDVDDPARRARVLEAGASDVMTRPVHTGELVARLRGHLRLKRLQDDLRVKNETLGRLSTVDALTGLRTRRYIDDLLSIEFLRAQRYAQPLAILMADLDFFKRVNDEHGHLGGDAALRGVSQILLHDMRATDVAGRFGGEEILVVLAQNDLSGAHVVAERWREAIEGARFAAQGQAAPIGVTVSIGIAALESDMSSPEALLGAADAALYRAKERGRNRVERAGPAAGWSLGADGEDDGPGGVEGEGA